MAEIHTLECGVCERYYDIDVEQEQPRRAVVMQERPTWPGWRDPVEVHVCGECWDDMPEEARPL